MTPPSSAIALMHAALDGEATPEELQELQRILASDPEARAEYDALRRLLETLRSLPKVDPPPGMAAAAVERFQLRRSQRVFVANSGPVRVPRSLTMNRPLSKRTILGGAVLAAAAVLLVGRFVFNVPSREGAVGTVTPAERYRAKQIQPSDVQLGDQAVTQLMQSESFERIIKDPQMRALAMDPGFQALARNTEAMAAFAKSAEAISALANNPAAVAALANSPGAMTAMAKSADAMAASPEVRVALANAPELRAVLASSPAAMSALANSPAAMSALANSPAAMSALARNPQAFSAMARDSGFTAMAMNPAFARALAMTANAASTEAK